jgi:hypothetical protein
MLRRGIEEDRRAGPTRECEGHVGTLGSIHLDTPSPTPALDIGEMVLKDLISCVRIGVQVSSANVARRMLAETWQKLASSYAEVDLL